MQDYSKISLEDARRDYLATSTTGMPFAGLIAWGALSISAFVLREDLPTYAAFVAAAIPFPLSLLIDNLRGEPGIQASSRQNPITQLFMKFIAVVGLLIPFVVISAQAASDPNLVILGLAILAGMVWVPHGWGADDPAGFVHFAVRSIICYAAYLFVPEGLKGTAIAGAAALTYVYAIIAMRKPSSVR